MAGTHGWIVPYRVLHARSRNRRHCLGQRLSGLLIGQSGLDEVIILDAGERHGTAQHSTAAQVGCPGGMDHSTPLLWGCPCFWKLRNDVPLICYSLATFVPWSDSLSGDDHLARPDLWSSLQSSGLRRECGDQWVPVRLSPVCTDSWGTALSSGRRLSISRRRACMQHQQRRAAAGLPAGVINLLLPRGNRRIEHPGACAESRQPGICYLTGKRPDPRGGAFPYLAPQLLGSSATTDALQHVVRAEEHLRIVNWS